MFGSVVISNLSFGIMIGALAFIMITGSGMYSVSALFMVWFSFVGVYLLCVYLLRVVKEAYNEYQLEYAS